MFKTSLALENWNSKYRYAEEAPLQTWERAAWALASTEKDPDYWYPIFLRTIVKFNSDSVPVGLKCTPGGRITANIGTKFKGATLLNCFINGPVSGASISYNRTTADGELSYPVKIDTPQTPDDLVNIFLSIMEQAKTLASEGGYGMNFDWIRPRGSLIKGTGIKHPGVVAYMKVWDAVAECIVKGDKDGYSDKLRNYLKSEEAVVEIKETLKKMTRKGAMLAALSVSHPDIEEFIRAKQQSGVLTKFNISVLIDNAFIEAVEKDDFYDQKFNGVVIKRVKARALYDLIMESTYNRAEPGVLFYDNLQANNPIAYLGSLNCANPCGEVGGNPLLTTVCLLGSPNLTQYVEIINGIPTFNWNDYIEDVKVFSRMLDNVCDLSNAPLPSYEWAIKNIRQFGMGINGLGSTLMMLGIKYNSPEAIAFTKKICSLKENLTWQTSALLAKEKGVFPAYNKEKFESTAYFKSDRITEETKALMRKYGVRNGKTTTCPPAGTTAIICDNTSNGIEPVFLLEYERKTIVSSWPTGLTSDNVRNILTYHKKKDFEYWEGEFEGKKYYYEPHNRGLCEVTVVRDYGYQWLLDNFPNKDHSEYLVTTKDLSVEDHLAIQEVLQYYNNQSTSKTINLPNKYPFSDFKKLYIEGWRRGLVGLTTYREGSMESVLSSIESASENKEVIKRDIKLPNEFINGPTKVVKKEGMKFYIHFSYLPEDTGLKHPVCLWIYTNSEEKGVSVVCNRASRELAKLALKCGIDQRIIGAAIEKCQKDYPHNRLGRMISLCLRHNIPREDILVCLKGIEGDHLSSLLTVVRKFIGETVKDGTVLRGAKCPNCGGDNIVMQAGCYSCNDCHSVGCG